MPWTERLIGVAAASLITASILLAAAYGVLYLQQTPAALVLVLIHVATCMFLAWRAIQAYSTGSIKRRHLPPIERQKRPSAFWARVSLYALLSVLIGHLWGLIRVFGPIQASFSNSGHDPPTLRPL
jgi:hypothetical protein